MTKTKKLTAAEKKAKKQFRAELRAEGILPPPKTPLNRKKFAKETVAEFRKMESFHGELYLRKAVFCMVGEDMDKVSPEQVGILKAMKIAVETEKFHQRMEEENRSSYTLGEYYNAVVKPIIEL